MADENTQAELDMNWSFTIEESDNDNDNEEIIHYISRKLLSLEDTFYQHVKTKYGEVNTHEDKDNAKSTCFNFNLHPSSLEFIEDMFIELNGINENLMKIIQSNYTKKGKIDSLCAKFREMKQLYSRLVVKYELIEEEAKLKEQKIEQLENLLKNAENDLYQLKHKQQFSDNFAYSTKCSTFIDDNKFQQTDLLAKTRIELQELKDEMTLMKDTNTHMLIEKKDAEKQMSNLKSLLVHKDKIIEEIRLNSDIEQKKCRELQNNLRQLQSEKNSIQKQENRRHDIPTSRFAQKKTTSQMMDEHCTPSEEEEIGGSIKTRHRKHLYCIEQKEGESLAHKLLNIIPEDTLSIQEEEEESNSLIQNVNQQSVALDVIDINPKPRLEKKESCFDTEHTLSEMLSHNFTEEDEPNPFIAMNEINKDKISLTQSLDNLETGLRSNRTKLQMSFADDEIFNLRNKKTSLKRQVTLTALKKRNEQYTVHKEIDMSFLTSSSKIRHKNHMRQKFNLLKRKRKKNISIKPDQKNNDSRKSTLVEFRKIFNEITTKFEVAGKEFQMIASRGSSFTQRPIQSQTRSHKSMLLHHLEEIPESPQIGKSSLKRIKEICFKIQSTSENKFNNMRRTAISFTIESLKVAKEYSRKLRDLYIKYFKYSHIYINEALKDISRWK